MNQEKIQPYCDEDFDRPIRGYLKPDDVNGYLYFCADIDPILEKKDKHISLLEDCIIKNQSQLTEMVQYVYKMNLYDKNSTLFPDLVKKQEQIKRLKELLVSSMEWIHGETSSSPNQILKEILVESRYYEKSQSEFIKEAQKIVENL